MFRMLVVAVSIARAFGLTQNVPPRPIAMQDLTAPKERLPVGCSLKTEPPPSPSFLPPSASGVVVVSGSAPNIAGITTNPWTGTDRQAIASIRERADPPPTLTDAPLTRAEASRYSLRLAEGVEEGYAAVYAQAGSNDSVAVYALRFAATERPFYSSDAQVSYPPPTRFEIGPIVAVVTGGRGECFQALEIYLNTLAK